MFSLSLSVRTQTDTRYTPLKPQTGHTHPGPETPRGDGTLFQTNFVRLVQNLPGSQGVEILVLYTLNEFVERALLLIHVCLRERASLVFEGHLRMFMYVQSEENVLHLCLLETLRACGDQAFAFLTVRRGEMTTQRPTPLSPAPLGLLYFPLSLPSVCFSSEFIELLCLNEISLTAYCPSQRYAGIYPVYVTLHKTLTHASLTC